MSLGRLKCQLQEKEKLLRKYSKDPIIRSSFFSHLKLYRKTRKRKCKEYKKNLIEQLDILKDNDPKKYWSLLCNLDKSNDNQNNEISGEDWYAYFKELNTSSNETDMDFILDKLKKVEVTKVFNELDFKISMKEISDAISSLKSKKSSSFDSILNEMLKYSQTSFLASFNKLFNTILTCGKFPKEWARGFIVPLFKNGSKDMKDDPSNYRGITIGSNIGKLFTKILNNRLENFFLKHKFICKEQIGFCQNKRTSDHMFILKTLLDKYTQGGKKYLFTCFIDFRKAFDRVWHIGLLYKLRTYGISDLFYSVIKNMYERTELCVKVEDQVTDFFPSSIGVRQGDNISPNLFKLYINDLPKIFDDSCEPVQLNDISINCLMYADDVVLLSKTSEGLQNCLDKLGDYCKKWKLSVNTNKTKVLIFNKSGKLVPEKFFLDKTVLENARNYTYLGVIFSISGSFTDAKKGIYKKGLKAYFKFLKCFEGHKPKLKTIIHVFDHTVKSVLLYGSEIWGYFPQGKVLDNNYFSKLCRDLPIELIHRKLCKNLLEVKKRSTTNAVMGELGRYPLMLEVVVNMLSYYSRLCKTDDALLHASFNCSNALAHESKQSWIGCIKEILHFFQLDKEKLLSTLKINKKYVYNKLHAKYNDI